MTLEPLILTVTRTGTDAELRVRSGHSILAGSITVEELARLATLFELEALELRRARNRVVEPSHYDVLGVSRDASDDNIQQAYRMRAKRCHPDTSTGDTAAAMAQLNSAYETLSDPVKRQQYDSTL